MEDSNSLDLTDRAEDRVHVPFAFTRDHADWLTADDQANFAGGTEASVTQPQEDAYAAMAKRYRYHARIVQSFTCFTRALRAADHLLQWRSTSRI